MIPYKQFVRSLTRKSAILYITVPGSPPLIHEEIKPRVVVAIVLLGYSA